jgi:hypothetical protein
VAGEYLLTSGADFRPVRLQAAEDSEHVILAVVVQELLAVFDHVWVASGALLIGTSPETRRALWRRRLRRQLRQSRWTRSQHNNNRQYAYTKHTRLSPKGIPPAT